MPSGLSYLKCLDRSIFTRRGVWVVFNQTKFYRNSFNGNRVDPDQASHSVASDLGPLFASDPFMGRSHKWVNRSELEYVWCFHR